MKESSHESWVWPKSPKHYSDEEKGRLMEKVVEVAVNTTFETHFYQWGGQLYRQRRGGAIGLKATGTAAKVAMEDWIIRLHKLLEAQGIQVYLLTKYVDDVLGILGTVQLGTRWEAGGMTHSEAYLEEDIKEGRSRQEVTLEVVREMANTLTLYLR